MKSQSGETMGNKAFWSDKDTVEKSWEYEGFTLIVVARPMGHRCGYIGLPKDHPSAGKHYDELNISVNGGLTFGNHNFYGLCYYGFDCAHSGDMKDPSIMSEKYKDLQREYPATMDYGTIKTKSFVINECESMARQFKKLERKRPTK